MDKPGWYEDPAQLGVKRWWDGTSFDTSKIMRAPGTYEGEGVPGGRGYWDGTAWESVEVPRGSRVSLRSVLVIAAVVVVAFAGAVTWRVASAPKTFVPVSINVVTETPHSAAACAQLSSLQTFLGEIGPLEVTPTEGYNPSVLVASYGAQGVRASENALSALGGYSSAVEGLRSSERTGLGELSASLVASQKGYSVLIPAAAKAARTPSQWTATLRGDLLSAEASAKSVQGHASVLKVLSAGCPT